MPRLLSWLVFSSLSVLLSAGFCNALAPEYQAAAEFKALEMYYRRPAYVYALGGKPEEGKIDCSKFVQKIFEDIGVIVGHQRTQAWRIYKGEDGFVNRAVGAEEPTNRADILCLAVPGSLQRPYGVNHVGMVIKWKNDWAVVDANASSKGIRIMPITGIWTRRLAPDGWRRITIGD